MKSGLTVGGYGVLRAYRAGVIPGILQAGFSYRAARILARQAMVREVITPNLVVTAGKILVAHFLLDDTGYDTGITYCAIGTDNTAVTAGDTTLGSESNRKACTYTSRSGAEATFETFFTAAQSTYNIKEVGWFGHDASGSADSGTLFVHYLQSEDNSGGVKDLTFSYVCEVT